MPNYPSNFISGAAPGVQSKNNISDRWELRIDRTVSVASVSQFTVTAATTANITLSGSQTIDSVTLSNGVSTVLVKNQSTAAQNGIYLYNSGGAWSRVTGFNEDSEVLQNVLVTVAAGGSTNGELKFYLSTDEPIVVGTTALTFTAAPTAVDYLSAANYPTDSSVGVGDISNPTHTLRDFQTALAHINKEITDYNTAYTALVALGDTQEGYDRSYLANLNSNKILKLKHQFLLEAYRLKRYTALMNHIVTNHAPVYSATSGSRYPSGWYRGWTV
jgi:hypothetical protein